MKFNLRNLYSSDENNFISLSAHEYGEKSDLVNRSYFVQKFIRNPAGTSEILTVLDTSDSEKSDQIVGRLILLPRKFKRRDKTFPLAFPTEFLIHEDYRDFFNLVSLLKFFKKNSKNKNCLLVPNKNSANIWEKLGGVPFFTNFLVAVAPIRPIKTISLSTGKKFKFDLLDDTFSFLVSKLFQLVNSFSSFRCEEITIDDLPKEDLNEYFSISELRGLRDSETIKWRLAFREKTSYVIIKILQKNTVVGYAIYALPQESYGQKPIVLLDLIAKPMLRKSLLRVAGRWAFIKGCKFKCNIVLLLMLGKELNGHYLSIFPLIKVPKKLVPESDKIFLNFEESNEKDFSLYLTLFDCDMF